MSVSDYMDLGTSSAAAPSAESAVMLPQNTTIPAPKTFDAPEPMGTSVDTSDIVLAPLLPVTRGRPAGSAPLMTGHEVAVRDTNTARHIAGISLLACAIAAAAGGYTYGVNGAIAGFAGMGGLSNLYSASRMRGINDAEAQAEMGRAVISALVDFGIAGWIGYHLYTEHHKR